MKWWGYQHKEGTLHVKLYFDARDTEEARESPFCANVFGPWEVSTRDEALAKLRSELTTQGARDAD